MEAIRKAHVVMIKAMRRLRGAVRHFHTFLAYSQYGETAAEKYIVGQEYDPWADRKLALCCRHPLLPHNRARQWCSAHSDRAGGIPEYDPDKLRLHESGYESEE